MTSILSAFRAVFFIALATGFAYSHATSSRADVEAVKARIYSAIFKSETRIVCIDNPSMDSADQFESYIADLRSALNAKTEYDLKCGSFDFDITGTQVIKQSLCLFVKAKSVSPTKSREVGRLQESCS